MTNHTNYNTQHNKGATPFSNLLSVETTLNGEPL